MVRHTLSILASAILQSGSSTPPSVAVCPALPSRPAAEWVERALSAVGADRLAGKILGSQATVTGSWNYQSDRPWYPPYLTTSARRQFWYDPATGVEGSGAVGPDGARNLMLSTRLATLARRDTALVPALALHGAALTARPMNPWAVLDDWKRAGDARVTGCRVYREFPRVVLSRGAAGTEERLLLDPKSGFPVMYGRTEPHYLWGQVEVEYVYATWLEAGSGYYPIQSYRLVDGVEEASRAMQQVATGVATEIPRDSAPDLSLSATPAPMTAPLDPFLVPTAPDTARIGAQAFLLKNRGYTEMVALERDTVFVFDATQGEERARQDSVWVGRLFPGRHPVVVVVTDLAWPHIAGVRFWVASGASIVSHRTSREMLQRVISRKWTLAPDRLERMRSTRKLILREVEDSANRAGGRVALYAINGVASEGALMALLPESGVLWASDYIQNPGRPTLYTSEVVRAVERAGIHPKQAVAQHLPVTAWEKLRALVP